MYFTPSRNIRLGGGGIQNKQKQKLNNTIIVFIDKTCYTNPIIWHELDFFGKVVHTLLSVVLI